MTDEPSRLPKLSEHFSGEGLRREGQDLASSDYSVGTYGENAGDLGDSIRNEQVTLFRREGYMRPRAASDQLEMEPDGERTQ